MRNKFDEQLENLHTELLEMGVLLEQGIKMSNNSLIQQNKEFAQKAIEIEKDVDDKERKIENFCLKLLLQQQPVAKDLRVISSALKMITDMERIGDQIADISEIILHLIGSSYINKIPLLPQMAEATGKMITGAIDAFVNGDIEKAKNVIKMDDIVDELFFLIKKEIIDLIKTDNLVGDYVFDFLMIAKYYERIGDHSVNIAEWVLFSITGEHKGKNSL